MTDIERQILLNQMVIIEALLPTAPNRGVGSTLELLRQRYHETARLVREQSKS